MKSNLVKILATLGLIVAIALVLKGVFGVGKIGFKNFSSKLPILKCEIFDPNAKNTINFYDLEQIKNDDPTQGMTREERIELRNQSNFEIVTFGDNVKGNQYHINFDNDVDGMHKGYSVTINKSSGKIEMRFPLPVPFGASLKQVSEALSGGHYFEGECIEVKRKKL
jgi:hypothetical protein